MRRWMLVVVATLSVLSASCSEGVEQATDVLTRTPTVSPTPTPTPTLASPSPSPSSEPGEEPAIEVATPVSGDEVVSPIRISGTADVFEATVSVRVLGGDGQELAATFATATCGSGCRGEFEVELFFFVEERQPGTVEVFEESAEDGSVINLVSVPVILVPGS